MWLTVLGLLLAFVAVRYFRGRLLGDLEMLALGATIYIALPFVAFEQEWLLEMPGIEGWRDLFQAASNTRVQLAALTAGLAAAYLLGRRGAQATLAKLGTSMNRPLSKPVPAAIAIVLWSIWFASALANRDSFFQGYSIDYDTGLLGNLATVNLIALATVLACRQHSQAGTAYRMLGLLLLINSIALLSLGGRLYVLIPAIALMLQSLASARSTLTRVRGFVVFVIVIALLLVVGAVRIEADLSNRFLAYIGLAEGLFTSMSLGSFIQHNGIPPLSTPANFFGSIVNFIPSALLADKANLVPTIQESGRFFESPLGATHLLVAILGNFGWLGGLGFAGALGWLFGSVRKVAPHGWWLYFYLCSLLPFMFFRDGFSIFNKAALFNGCIVMWCVFAVDRTLLREHAPRRRRLRNAVADAAART